MLLLDPLLPPITHIFLNQLGTILINIYIDRTNNEKFVNSNSGKKENKMQTILMLEI
jgi:hypothetical protein